MRKKPKQKRSRQMVDALIEATAQTIIDKGLDAVTTHHIADAAGVSVGSLYQYFDGKEMLIEALMDKLANDIASLLVQLPMIEGGSLRHNVQSIIEFGFSVLHSRDGLFLELVSNWNNLHTDKVMDTLQQSFMDLSRLYFLKNYQQNPIEDLHVRVFIIVNSVLFNMVRFIGQNTALLTQQQVVSGMTDMVVGYLNADQDPHGAQVLTP